MTLEKSERAREVFYYMRKVLENKIKNGKSEISLQEWESAFQNAEVWFIYKVLQYNKIVINISRDCIFAFV